MKNVPWQAVLRGASLAWVCKETMIALPAKRCE
jgi:hypothetical protein